MCGRYVVNTTKTILKKKFKVKSVPDVKLERYNIAPTQEIIAVRSIKGEREIALLRWGLIPYWAKEAEIGNRMINARSESVMEKHSFKPPFQKRRCLIAASGFYEWQTSKTGKQPYLFQLKDESLFAFAGLWESWRDDKNKVIETCTILTTSANELLKPVHDRMPVILAESDYELWLDEDTHKQQERLDLLRPFSADEMKSHAVSTLVNSPQNDDIHCIDPL
jgi:putative SOS response-associated peptidase YedK